MKNKIGYRLPICIEWSDMKRSESNVLDTLLPRWSHLSSALYHVFPLQTGCHDNHSDIALNHCLNDGKKRPVFAGGKGGGVGGGFISVPLLLLAPIRITSQPT